GLARGCSTVRHGASVSPRSGRRFTNAPRESLMRLRKPGMQPARCTWRRAAGRINAPVSFGLLHLAPAITDFLQRFPDISVEMRVNGRVVDLLEGEFDVGVRVGRLCDSSLIARRITPVRLAVCAAPDYLARRGAPKTPDDLAKHDCLEYTYFESRGEWRLLNPDGKEIVVPVSGRYLANNADVLRTTAIAGGGIVLLPTF